MSDSKLELLMNPRSIAIVGASERAEAIGSRVIRNLLRMNYSGRIYPVNPRYGEIAGLACYPSLSALPERVDAVFLAVPAAQGPALMDEAAACGIRAVFINANGYADGDAGGAALQRRIEATAAAHDMAVCGPNNLGLINVIEGSAIWATRNLAAIRKGPLALISQSGSVAIALAEDERKLGFSYLITAGNEAVTTVAEYLGALARDDRVEVILLFLETIRNVEAFAAAAREATERGKRILALKLGSSEGGRALVQAHTGSLAGEDRLYDAFFERLGIVRVRDFDEMLETALLFTAYSKPPTAPHFVPVTLSGGEAALVADMGNALGVPFAPLSPETLARLRPAFPPYSTIRNPLDAWGLGFEPERFALVLEALLQDPAIGTIGFSVDAPAPGGGDLHFAVVMAEACVAAASRTDKRFVYFNNTSGTGPNAELKAILDRAGIPYLSGLRPALAAIGHYQRLAPPRPAAPATPAPPDWQSRALSSRDTDRFSLLAAAGLPMAACAPVSSKSAIAAAAERLGFPLALKGTAPGILHKSDVGLVRLGLDGTQAIAAAYDEVARILGERAGQKSSGEIYLQKMSAPGVELIVGVRNEPGFGSFILVGAGGIFVEIIGKVSIRLGPVDAAEARAMLDETPAGKLLAGARGRGPYDAAAAAEAIAALSRLGAATVGALASIEINPLIVHARGATGVDVVIEARASVTGE